jgi:hypothetical protein
MIIQTYRCAADLLNMDIEDLKTTVKQNAAHLFAPALPIPEKYTLCASR